MLRLTLIFEKKQIVTPGELLAEGDYIPGENVYRENNRLYAQKLGLADADADGRAVFVVALRARYFPLVGDTVIGQIIDIGLHGWTVDINAPYGAMLSLSDVVGRSFNPQMESLSNILGVGDIIVGQVTIFDRTTDPHITIQGPGLGRVSGGVVVGLTPTKIPRLIGKQGSMISLLKQGTGCDVIVGINGKVLIRGREQKEIEIVIKAINMIESSSHLSGLTDRIQTLLENEKRR